MLSETIQCRCTVTVSVSDKLFQPGVDAMAFKSVICKAPAHALINRVQTYLKGPGPSMINNVVRVCYYGKCGMIARKDLLPQELKSWRSSCVSHFSTQGHTHAFGVATSKAQRNAAGVR